MSKEGLTKKKRERASGLTVFHRRRPQNGGVPDYNTLFL